MERQTSKLKIDWASKCYEIVKNWHIFSTGDNIRMGIRFRTDIFGVKEDDLAKLDEKLIRRFDRLLCRSDKDHEKPSLRGRLRYLPYATMSSSEVKQRYSSNSHHFPYSTIKTRSINSRLWPFAILSYHDIKFNTNCRSRVSYGLVSGIFSQNNNKKKRLKHANFPSQNQFVNEVTTHSCSTSKIDRKIKEASNTEEEI